MAIRENDTDVGRYVVQIVESFEKRCKLECCNYIPEIEWKNILPERTLIGRGSFSNVYRVTLNISLGETIAEESDKSQQMFALKRLNSVMPADTRKFKNAAFDIALEVSLLKRLRHPNIIHLHAVKSGDLEESINYRDYFLVLDILVRTLNKQLKIWSRQCNLIFCIFNRKFQNNRLMNRLESTILGIVKGMEYLHSKNIIFRDLKPENVGFDINHTVRIFDFGLARDLNYEREHGSLGRAGTVQYMASEVIKKRKSRMPYGLKADIYSFGILFWEVCTLQRAYRGASDMEHYYEQVIRNGQRPDLESIPFQVLRGLISKCWDPNPDMRPTFTEIKQELETFLRNHTHKTKSSLKTNTFGEKQGKKKRNKRYDNSSDEYIYNTDSAFATTTARTGTATWNISTNR